MLITSPRFKIIAAASAATDNLSLKTLSVRSARNFRCAQTQMF
jgi:hypothetical protein